MKRRLHDTPRARWTILLVTALALSAFGCKKKSKTATPGEAKDSAAEQSMNDKEPIDDGTAGGGKDGKSGTSEGGAKDESGADGKGEGSGEGKGGKEGEGGEPAPIVIPNLDAAPESAKALVTGHLTAGRAALAKQPPDTDAAIASAKQALAADATSLDAQVLIAHAYYHKKLYDTAEVLLDMLLTSRGDAKANAGIYYVYGLVYDQKKDPRAQTAYQTAVSLNPNFGSALINLGVHQLRNKQFREAQATYERVTGALAIHSAEVWNAMGAAYRGRSSEWQPGATERDQFLRKAEEAYKRAITLKRDYAPAYYNLGLLYLDADPFPGPGGPLDSLARLGQARTYLEEYKSQPGADRTLAEERLKDVNKLIKREEKKRRSSP